MVAGSGSPKIGGSLRSSVSEGCGWPAIAARHGDAVAWKAFLSIGELVAGAGGDPWEINRTLQAGQPGQISNLANAFHAAGRSTAEADHAFELARQPLQRGLESPER